MRLGEKMLVLKPTMSVRVLQKIDYGFTLVFNLICEYAWPVVKWITSTNLLKVTNNEEMEEDDDGKDLHENNMETFRVPEICIDTSECSKAFTNS